ncbi:hypothetical protein BB560_000946, partial [Smittium megazygosporum]
MTHNLNKVNKSYIQNLYIENSGVNPETKLNALNEAQNNKEATSLSRETNPNEITTSESDMEINLEHSRLPRFKKRIETLKPLFQPDYSILSIQEIHYIYFKEDKRPFYHKLYTSFEKASNTILLGDFNITKSNTTDRHPPWETPSEYFLLKKKICNTIEPYYKKLYSKGLTNSKARKELVGYLRASIDKKDKKMLLSPISGTEIEYTINTTKNSSSPVPGRLTYNLYKQFAGTVSDVLAKLFDEFLKNHVLSGYFRKSRMNLRVIIISNASESQTAISGLGRRVGQLDAGQTENAEYQGTKSDQSPY